MPTAITLASPAAFTSPLFPPLPVIAGNILWTYFGTSLAQSPNLGTGGALTNTGTGPAWTAGYGRFMGANGALVSPAGFQPRAGTFMAVARNYAGGSSGAGPSLCASSGAGSIQFAVSTTAAAGNVTLFTSSVGGSVLNHAVTNLAAFKFYSGSWGNGTAYQIYNETDATASAPGSVGSPSTDGAGLQYVGYNGVTNDRPIDIAFIALYNSVLSKATIDTIYAHVKSVLAGRGVSV